MPGYAIRMPLGTAVEGPLWRALAAADRPATVIDLHTACSAAPNSIQHRLSRWVSAGLVTRINGRPVRFVMNDTTERTPTPPRVSISGRAVPRTRTARDRMWSAMRVLKSFDLPMLIIASEATRRSCEDYVNCLQRSGHLRRTRRGNSMTGEWSNYTLTRNTGRSAPSVSHCRIDGARQRTVIDRNTGQRHDISVGRVNLRKPGSKPTPVDGGVS